MARTSIIFYRQTAFLSMVFLLSADDPAAMPARQAAYSTAIIQTSDERVRMNVLFVIFPYKQHGVWVFDDERVGLIREPFVAGADAILDVLTANLPQAEQGVKLVFSAAPFPGYTARFVLERSEYGGNWYRWPEKGMEGWLCPALFKYFDQAPPELFVSVSAKS
jgi:hypothetical protein